MLGKMQSSSMQQIMLVYEEVRRLEGRQNAAGGQDWVVRRGGLPTSHTPTDSLMPTGGGGTCGYLPLQEGGDKGTPLSAGLSALLRGSGQGRFAEPWKAWKGAGGYLPRPSLGRYLRGDVSLSCSSRVARAVLFCLLLPWTKRHIVPRPDRVA